ncbi:putative E3 ubiquitin-protein ligase RHB1A [Nicotiana tabacum]|uniref:RING-type E3 ubiquitin transferase n=2 Tax=Nicotiana TaxID=4085 RepID=A0A1S4B840_TOBAC|nr:PREDICTED: E3 ubiquitin-protein ligase At3g02290 [Nicotiana sylvestris]XP_016485039.1 PREDICTED: E3 ubiquitin-protein ligase At3g02290-like [Nicotiana tabacum]
MGNCCCCCASKGVELNGSPSFCRYPTVPEEREPLSSHNVTAAALSTALLVDTNLDTSSPDTYRPPPMPMPYETYVGRPRTPPGNQDGIKNDAAVQETSTETGVALNTADAVEAAEKDNKESEGIVQADVPLAAPKEVEDELEESEELKKSNILVFLPPQEECPICLEEYDAENPKMSTKCEHHFHLSCILEWMERSDTCPVCDQETVFNPAIDG